ncbi:MAG: hypothetical protein JO316_18420 [Abitibacteriaceae bacterium]|nr:hypothetical protein [Abditibacteriaceae bacterium]MBV9867336.1 hypothetical protein [Abditibacteriaceae bacterium]
MSDNSLNPQPQTLNPNLTGWKLDEAQVVLQSSEQTKHYSLKIIETAPPQRPQPKERSVIAPKKSKPEKGGQGKMPEVHYGAWRVLRCQLIQEADSQPAIELLIAREQIR